VTLERNIHHARIAQFIHTMHSKKDSVLKRWHSLTANPARFATKWQGTFWANEPDNLRSVRCKNCRSFNAEKQQCGIGFGTPLRKCVVSSIEAHFNNCAEENCLEIGFGRFMLARNLIRRSGGTWTGIDPQIDKSVPAQIGSGCYGTASGIPFPDNTFNRAFGIQSIEHWGQKVHGITPSNYDDCLREIHRVLKPGGSIYFDAPIHFHGHEMFIMGDMPRIRALFDESLWQNITMEQWRKEYHPLEKYPPSSTVLNNDWPAEIESYSEEQMDECGEQSVYMIAITASKK